MCFNKEFTLAFTLMSIAIGSYILTGRGIWKTDRWRLIRIAACFYFFAGMEFLQYVQYLVIDDCQNQVNIWFTALGWIHIAFQPLFSNLAFSALDKGNLRKEKDHTWKYIFKFCTFVGITMSLRLIIPALFPEVNGKSLFFTMCDEEREGICGPATCSTTGLYHVQWTFKMITHSYPFPSVAVHFMDMFIAPILMGMHVGAVTLFFTGPAIALLFSGVKDGERSAIWCFFSIAETFITVFSQYLAVRRAKKASEK